MEISIEHIEILLLVSAIVSMLARRLHLPYTVGLTLAGLALALIPSTTGVTLTRELIFTAFLPPLIFEAAFHIQWPELRRDLPVTLVLATLGVIISAAITAGGLIWWFNWPWTSALLLAVLISATDPVSVIATFKEANVQGRLRLLVEAESLFNDGTVAVLFGVALAAAMGSTLTTGGVAGGFLLTVVGGILCGLLVGGFVLLLAGRTEDHLVEVTFSSVAAYGSFLLAEHLHLSGVLATLAAGMLLGNTDALGAFSSRGRQAVERYWEYIGFVANSLVFLLIGLRLAHQQLFAVWLVALTVIFLVTLGRALAVYGCCAVFGNSSHRVKGSHQHVLFWGGLRGALALALALGLPEGIALREEIVSVSFAVVAFSVIVQGLTMNPLLRRLGEIPEPSHKDPANLVRQEPA